MRTIRSIPTAILVALAMVLMLGVTSVSAGPANATRVYFVAMTGDQEATATCSPPALCGDEDASGEAIIIVNPKTDTVCFLMRWRDIDGTVFAAHIHDADVGVAGPIVVPLFGPVSLSGDDRARGCVPGLGWTDDINADPGGFYVNVHSTDFPGGAIRGQLG